MICGLIAWVEYELWSLTDVWKIPTSRPYQQKDSLTFVNVSFSFVEDMIMYYHYAYNDS